MPADPRANNERVFVVDAANVQRVSRLLQRNRDTAARDDRLQQIRALAHHVAVHRLAMVVMPTIRYDGAHPEELLEEVQTADALRPLRYRELVCYLVAGSVAAATFAVALSGESDRESSFSVYKTDNPARLDQPFLLVFRTIRIFTARTHDCRVRRVADGYIGFSSI